MDEQIFIALDKYFKELRIMGYKSYKDVYKVIFLMAMSDIIQNDFDAALSEQDYRDINAAIYCIYGTDCMFPYPKYCKCKK